MANPQVFVNRTMDFFQRHNPVVLVAFSVVQTVYFVITWQSRVKIMKYKLMLEVERLERMQQALYADPVHQAQMGKMNRIY